MLLRVLGLILAICLISGASAEYESKARVAKPAPLFKGRENAVLGSDFVDIDLSSYLGEKYVVLLFYPKDFTFVCPTEIIAFSEAMPQFRELKTEVIGISTDTTYSHLAWTKVPRREGGLGQIDFPLLEDPSHQISKDYGCLIEEEGVDHRCLVIISDSGIIRHISINHEQVGRSVDEVLRLIRAYKHTDEHGVVCPANWVPGKRTLIADPVKKLEFFQDCDEETEKKELPQ